MSDIIITSSANSFSDFEDTLPQTLNSELVYQNTIGAASMCVKVVVPAGGEVTFQGSADGVTYDNISLRGIVSDTYSSKITVSQQVIGSISCLRSIKFLVSSGGSSPGSIKGRATLYPNTIEGQEHGHQPHNIGATPLHKDFDFTTQQTDTALWTPASGKKIIVTDMIIVPSGSIDGLVQLFDNTNSAGNRLIQFFYDGSINSVAPISCNLVVPFVSSAVNNIIKLTTGSAMRISGILHGYEI